MTGYIFDKYKTLRKSLDKHGQHACMTTEYGVRYYTVVNEEGRELKLKTNRWIEPEDVWFMISENERFPIDPVLLKKFW